ncbi:polyprenyl diphosphate synthase [Endozoicomonas sp. SCSIO W0465]|uniref:polyprenyl diphosphate synthase n=1 Tax=Endozoicomonas sp. SCSIO W0465 TaxID=2918516 RepID=UPI002074DC30|nr:polyprenyl diphosphate synthase [Endozoicomonas sp. SCSIO W0465]USE35392.1 polyprenyl diphosphate synthase [Endozoicomonas sp. SCSIO W0465]
MISNPPQHIAIIMDGNNRWARRSLLPALSGHRAAINTVRDVIKRCRELGIPWLTLFAFSSENWRRPADEVSGLMQLLLNALEKEAGKLEQHDICLKIIGDCSALSPQIQAAIGRCEAKTAKCRAMTLMVAVNYGGQWDLTRAFRRLAAVVKAEDLEPESIQPGQIEEYLATEDAPPVDLLIRTSGEKRISNFLLWQCAYAEFYFCDTLWPDFTAQDLDGAIADFQGRERRFGRSE